MKWSRGVALAIGATAGAQAQFDPATALNFAYLAGAAYCDGSSINSWTCNPCQTFASSVQGATFISSDSDGVYGYVAQANDGTVIVSFRGTDPSNIQDWIVDLNASKAEIYPGCSGCEVHSGFYTGYLNLAGQMKAAVDQYGGMDAPMIIVTGHSLGAAMGTIAAFELALGGYPLTQIINFGDPRVGNPAFAVAYESLVINGNSASVRMWAPEEEAAARKRKGGEQGRTRWSPLLTDTVARALKRAATTADHESLASRMHAAVSEAVKDARSGNFRGKRAALRAGFDALRRAALTNLTFETGSFQGAGNIRVTHARDPVPHLPLEAMGFQHAPQEVWYNEDNTQYTVCSTSNGEDPSCSDSNWFDLDIPDHLNYMGIHISGLC